MECLAIKIIKGQEDDLIEKFKEVTDNIRGSGRCLVFSVILPFFVMFSVKIC